MIILKSIRQDIRFKFVFLLLLGSFTLSSSFFAYNYFENKTYLQDKTEENAERIIVRLSQNLIIPLWEIDNKWADTIASIEMLAPEMEAIAITGEGNLHVFKKRSADDIVEDSSLKVEIDDFFIKRTLPIINDEKEIGNVTIYISDKILNKELERVLFQNVSITIIIMIFLILAPLIILDKLILHPLSKILHIVKNAGKHNYTNRLEILEDDQIGLLSEEFNSMMDNIVAKEEIMLAQSRQAAMGEMISMIAHQWRQPITVIAMISNNILLEAELNMIEINKLKENANKILKQTVHLSNTIDDFRNFFSPNKLKELVNITDIIEDNLKIIGKSLENNNISVEKEYLSTTPTFIYSRELLQVVINIFKNAKEALIENSIADATIFVKTKEDENDIYISICDNGKGIPKDIINRIFEPYFTTKDEKNGTGLGLYMSKTIVEKHLYGSIIAKNVENGGACFLIQIPKNIEK